MLFIVVVFCVVFWVCLSLFCALCSMLPVSLDCPLFVASSCVFSELYYRMVETCVTLRGEGVNLISSKYIF